MKKYILEGVEVKPEADLAKWALFILEGKRVISIFSECKIKVYTQFLGMDMGEGEGKPLVFKSTVHGSFLNGYCEYYTTFEEALQGHERIVEKVKQIICR